MGSLATLAACNPFAGPDEEVVLIVGSAHYLAGEDISFEIRNGLPHAVTVPVCSDGTPKIVLLRRISARWHSLDAQCLLAPAVELAAGERMTGTRPGVSGPEVEGLYALALHFDAPPGRYYDDGFGVAPVPLIANSKAFQITE